MDVQTYININILSTQAVLNIVHNTNVSPGKTLNNSINECGWANVWFALQGLALSRFVYLKCKKILFNCS